MLQAQRPSKQQQRPGQGARTTTNGQQRRHSGQGQQGGKALSGNGSYNVMSESICDRRMELGQSYYQDAKKCIGDALTADEKGHCMEALELYSKSLSTIRSGLAVLQSSVGAEIAQNSALLKLRAKMERMKEQIKSRMEDLLQSEIKARALAKSTDPGAATTSNPAGHMTASSVGGKSLGAGFKEEAKADVLFNLDSGIGLFEVDQKDHVRKYNDADAISIFKYRNKIEGQPPAFLQCGGYVYPLLPGKSPILKAGERMYMFPELRSGDGRSVGVSLDSASEAEIAQLDQLLSQLADFKTAEEVSRLTQEEGGERAGKKELPKGEATWGSSVAGGIDKGVSWMSNKIAQGTEVAGNLIIKGATKIRDQIEPGEKPVEIPSPVVKGVHYTRKATHCVVGVSDFLMTSLARLTVRVGKGVKEAVEDSEYVKSREVNPHLKEGWKVTKSGVKGAAAVFTDLKEGAVAIVKATGKEASHTVGHKYGPDAEKVTEDGLAAAGSTASLVYTYWSWKTWGITFLGKVGEVISKDSKDKGKDAGEEAKK